MAISAPNPPALPLLAPARPQEGFGGALGPSAPPPPTPPLTACDGRNVPENGWEWLGMRGGSWPGGLEKPGAPEGVGNPAAPPRLQPQLPWMKICPRNPKFSLGLQWSRFKPAEDTRAPALTPACLDREILGYFHGNVAALATPGSLFAPQELQIRLECWFFPSPGCLESGIFGSSHGDVAGLATPGSLSAPHELQITQAGFGMLGFPIPWNASCSSWS